jgi:acyl-CoA synthetase (AMP-forming)/AMP-acid ligase II
MHSRGYALTTEQASIFMTMPTSKVFDDNLVEVTPGSDTVAIAYASGYSPIAYYHALEKSAGTFVTINGQCYVKTGDRCLVKANGMIELLGKDSTVINTGGEKVYTVEVEQILLRYQAISNAVVIGLPHPRFGKMVAAVVEGPQLNADTIDVAAIQADLK